jgi:hypothetical protein
MKDTFRWERDTENYRRYVSERKDPITERFCVIYFPRSIGDLPKIIPDMITTSSNYGLQCCNRDNDFDGNCEIHEAPGVLRERFRAPDYLERGYDLSGTQTGRFSSHHMYSPESVRSMVLQLMTRMNVVENRQGVLFQAVEKIIVLLKPIRSWLKWKAAQAGRR